MDPTLSDTFRTIATRLTMFRPQLDLTKHIKKGPHPKPAPSTARRRRSASS